MNPFIEASLIACEEIRTTLRGNATLFASYEQGFGGDISSGFDLEAEKILFHHLHRFGSVFSEESGWMSPQSDCNIIIDPIDGSDNFASSFPYYGIAIAREINTITVESVVCNLANGDVFIRTRDEYYRTSLLLPTTKEKITVTKNPKIGLFEKAHEHPFLGEKLMQNSLKFRSPGAVALSLAYAPYVKYVLFLGTMRKFDIQAGLYLSSHLYSYNDSRYILISSDKAVFEKMRTIVEKEYF